MPLWAACHDRVEDVSLWRNTFASLYQDPSSPLIEYLWPLLVGIWGTLQGSWGI